MRKDSRTWVLFAGIILIVVACLIAYLVSKPAEANLSMQMELLSLLMLA